MAARPGQRLRAIAERITVLHTPPQSATDLRKRAATVAKQKLVQVIARDRPSSYKVFVDGVEGGNEDNVRDRIVYKFSYIKEIVQEAFALIVKGSPEQTGPSKVWNTPPDPVKYKENHVIFQDGQVIKSFDELDGDKEVMITNLLPYARKIEINYKNFYVTNGAYEKAAAVLKRRFGNMVNIKFTFMVYGQLPRTGYIRGQAAPGKRAYARKDLTKRRDIVNNLRYPTLIITPI